MPGVIDLRGYLLATYLVSKGTLFQRFIQSPAHTVVQLIKYEIGDKRTRDPYVVGYLAHYSLSYSVRGLILLILERARWRHCEWFVVFSYILVRDNGRALEISVMQSAIHNEVQHEYCVVV